jgi:flagellin
MFVGGSLSALETAFEVGKAGNDYIFSLYSSGALSDDDVGAIGGANADGGDRDTTAEGIVPDVANDTTDPLRQFAETFPSGQKAISLATTRSFQYQVGANVGETIKVEAVAVNAGNLGVDEIGVVSDAEGAILRFDAAMTAVSNERARLGAIQNRFESAASAISISIENDTSSRGRILDADYAIETANVTRVQILQQPGIAMLSQANVQLQSALALLQ